MRAVLVLVLATLFGFSQASNAVVFDNKSNHDIEFILAVRHGSGQKVLPILAHRKSSKLVAKFFEKDLPSNTLWIFARWGTELPVNDIFCHPTLTVKQLRENDNSYKIIFDGKKCDVESVAF